MPLCSLTVVLRIFCRELLSSVFCSNLEWRPLYWTKTYNLFCIYSLFHTTHSVRSPVSWSSCTPLERPKSHNLRSQFYSTEDTEEKTQEWRRVSTSDKKELRLPTVPTIEATIPSCCLLRPGGSVPPLPHQKMTDDHTCSQVTYTSRDILGRKKISVAKWMMSILLLFLLKMRTTIGLTAFSSTLEGLRSLCSTEAEWIYLSAQRIW